MKEINNYILEKLHINKDSKYYNPKTILDEILKHTFIKMYIETDPWAGIPENSSKIINVIKDWIDENKVNKVHFYSTVDDLKVMKLNKYDSELLNDIKVIDKSDILYKQKYDDDSYSDTDLYIATNKDTLKVILYATTIFVNKN